MHFVGPHVSIGGGVFNAPVSSRALGATGFGMFLKNQKQWTAAELSAQVVEEFRAAMGDFSERAVLPHAGYLINLANPDEDAHGKSMVALVDELTRARTLGVMRVNLHPGSHLRKLTPEAACERVAQSIDKAAELVPDVKIVIENTAGQGGCLGHTFDELQLILQGVSHKERLGFCLDTAHTFESGMDLRTRDGFLAIIDEFDAKVGMDRLCGLHLNDSKTPLGSRVDRHESLGKGHIGLEVFKTIMGDRRFENIPLVMETPDEKIWAEEIAMLLSYAG